MAKASQPMLNSFIDRRSLISIANRLRLSVLEINSNMIQSGRKVKEIPKDARIPPSHPLPPLPVPIVPALSSPPVRPAHSRSLSPFPFPFPTQHQSINAHPQSYRHTSTSIPPQPPDHCSGAISTTPTPSDAAAGDQSQTAA